MARGCRRHMLSAVAQGPCVCMRGCQLLQGRGGDSESTGAINLHRDGWKKTWNGGDEGGTNAHTVHWAHEPARQPMNTSMVFSSRGRHGWRSAAWRKGSGWGTGRVKTETPTPHETQKCLCGIQNDDGRESNDNPTVRKCREYVRQSRVFGKKAGLGLDGANNFRGLLAHGRE